MHSNNCCCCLDADQCTGDDAKSPPLVLAADHVPLDFFNEAGEEAFRPGDPDDSFEDIVIEPGDRENNSFLTLLHKSKNVNGQGQLLYILPAKEEMLEW